MAFIPRTSPPPQQQPAPSQPTFRVADPSSSKGPILGVILAAVLLLFYGCDAYRSATHTGIYRQDFAGEVISARPTFMSVTDSIFSGRRRRYTTRSSYRDGQNLGHYVLFLRDENGKTVKVSVSKNTYNSTLIPSYVVGHSGSVRGFKSRPDAVKAGAVERQPGDPL